MSTKALDMLLWALLEQDIRLAMAEDRFPSPPRTPAFARETVRPRKAAS